MNKLKQLASRLRARFAPRQGKSGSSLAFVVTIGAALVIWVMAIMPTMTATGTAAVKLQNSQSDYLDGKSAIEFAKSELKKIVVDKLPYTFAVIRQEGAEYDTYEVMAKSSLIQADTQYYSYVNASTTDDSKDVPQNTNLGNQVAAICAVTQNAEGKYDVAITSYNNGEKGLTYNTVFTPSGSLKINPEAYNQTQALPLSDFVLVDGQLGTNQVWVSTIASISNTSFTETLLPWKMNPGSGYADSGEYPAVFKMTAEAATFNSEGVGAPIVDEFTSDKQWIRPSSALETSKTTEGAIWLDDSDVKMYVKGNAVTLASDTYTIYYNGSEDVPTASGIYNITLDYTGTGEYSESNPYNALPANGIQLGTRNIDTDKHNISGAKITGATVTDGKMTVTMANISGVRYGYCDQNSTTITWCDAGDTTLENLDPALTYLFYCYKPAGFTKGIYYAASDISYLGAITPFVLETELEDGGKYAVLGKYTSGNTNFYYGMANDNGSLKSILYAGGDNTIYTGKDAAGEDVSVFYVGDGAAMANNLSNLTWTMVNKKNNRGELTNSWYFTQGANNDQGEYVPNTYLEMTGEYSQQRDKWTHNPNVNSSNENGLFTININSNDSAASVSRNFSYTYTTGWGPWKEEVTKTSTAYLNISSNTVTCNTNSSSVYFIKAPVVPNVDVSATVDGGGYKSKTYSYVHGTTDLKTKINNEISGLYLTTIYANGTEIDDTTQLNAGQYMLIGQASNSVYYQIGTLTIDQKTGSTLSLEVEVKKDDMEFKVTGTGWNTDGGIRYVGYKTDTDTDYHWYRYTGSSFTFCLDYGTYDFAVAQSGGTNYSANKAEVKNVTMAADPVSLEEDAKTQFTYVIDDNGQVTWYKLPDGLNPSRLTMVYGSIGADGEIEWNTTYDQSTTRYYGVAISNSDYTTRNPFQLSPPLALTIAEGHMSSMLRGSSLYFMGEGKSIETYNNAIYLTTDLLVLKNPIGGNGAVYVSPYSVNENNVGDDNTLVYFVTAMGPFEAKTFYLVPKDTDINWYIAKGSFGESSGIRVCTSSEVKTWFQNGIFPEINMDISYATSTQLQHIVSGETIGWTEDGVLVEKATDTSTNELYAVCAYVESVAGTVSRSANRILIAARQTTEEVTDEDGTVSQKPLSVYTYNFEVPKDITFTTRYLSIDAAAIQQGSSDVNLYLVNLAKDSTFLSELLTALEVEVYLSKTLQMDYERNTTIVYADKTTAAETAKICRYDGTVSINGSTYTGVDLFAAPEVQPVMVSYTAQEIEAAIQNETASVGITDRYITLSSNDGKLKIDKFLTGVKIDIRANYIHIDSTVTTIDLTPMINLGWSFTPADIEVSSQESGYSNIEYLGLFNSIFSSTESYSGTLIYVEANSLQIKYMKSTYIGYVTSSATLNKGFYYFYATDTGTSLTKVDGGLLVYNSNATTPEELAAAQQALDANAQGDRLPYRVNPLTLKEYSVYIDTEGNISDAYVETGLFSNDTLGVGGFSGGSVG